MHVYGIPLHIKFTPFTEYFNINLVNKTCWEQKMSDKLIRVSEETHQRLTDLGRKGQTYDDIIAHLIETSKISQEILTLCSEVKNTLDSSRTYPAKSPFRTSAFQAMARDIREKVSKIENLAKVER